MKNLLNDIKNNSIKKVYLIYGEEKYLVRNSKNILINGIVPKDDTMNYCKFSGKDVNPLEVMDFANTIPFFADKRVVLLQDTFWCKNGCDTIATYIKEIPDSACVIFVETEVDKRNKLYKQIKSVGYVCECNRASNKELTDWMLKIITKAGKKITKETMDYLLAVLGNDMDKIHSELDKLLAYTLKKNIIEICDIDNICCSEITGKIFDMIDAMGNKNQKKALDLYYDLIAVKEAPMKILFMLTRQFNILYQVKEMSSKRMSNSEIASKMGMAPFIINKVIGQCKNFSILTIRKAMEDCIEMETAIKQGNLSDNMAVELILIKYTKI